MSKVGYRYELRREGEVLATGYLSWEHELAPGDTVSIAGHHGIVRSVRAQLGDQTQLLMLETP
jgi:hypothetical protein